METPEDSEYQFLSAFLKFPKEKRETFMEEIRKIDQLIQDLDVHIETSKKGILGLQDNWDDEGAQGYSEETWLRTTEFLRLFLKQIWMRSIFIPFPKILPAPDGRIRSYVPA